MSLAVAMTKTLSFLSFNQVRKVPKMRLVVPESLPLPS